MMNLTDSFGGTDPVNNAKLAKNAESRKRRQMLVTDNNEYMDRESAMQEIFDRKRARGKQAKAAKMADYRDRYSLSFAECEEHDFADAAYRKAIRDGKMKGDFAGEGMSFPIASAEDVRRAWMSVGRSNQDTKKVQRKILRIAKKYNWEAGLPKAVRDRMKKGGSGLPE